MDLEPFFKKLKEAYLKLINIEHFETELFPKVLESISYSYHWKPHKRGRLEQIYNEALRRYFKELKVYYLYDFEEKKGNHEVRKKIFYDRLEALKSDIEKNFYINKKEIDNYDLARAFPCPLSKWDYAYDSNSDEYMLTNTKTCSNACSKFKVLIKQFYDKNKNYIMKIKNKYYQICNKLNIQNPDKRFFNTLIKIIKGIENKSPKISIKYCRRLGDFFISILINKDTKIFTNNKRHFLPLIKIKGYKNKIIELATKLQRLKKHPAQMQR